MKWQRLAPGSYECWPIGAEVYHSDRGWTVYLRQSEWPQIIGHYRTLRTAQRAAVRRAKKRQREREEREEARRRFVKAVLGKG